MLFSWAVSRCLITLLLLLSILVPAIPSKDVGCCLHEECGEGNYCDGCLRRWDGLIQLGQCHRQLSIGNVCQYDYQCDQFPGFYANAAYCHGNVLDGGQQVNGTCHQTLKLGSPCRNNVQCAHACCSCNEEATTEFTARKCVIGMDAKEFDSTGNNRSTVVFISLGLFLVIFVTFLYRLRRKRRLWKKLRAERSASVMSRASDSSEASYRPPSISNAGSHAGSNTSGVGGNTTSKGVRTRTSTIDHVF